MATGTVFNEAGVPLVKELSSFSLFVDTTGTRNTALAIVNTGTPVPSIVHLTVFDKLFQVIATTDFPMLVGQQINNFIPNFFDTKQFPIINHMEGSATVTPQSAPLGFGGAPAPRLAGLTVRTNNAGGSFPAVVPTFTAFPVVPGAAALVSTGVVGTVSQESAGTLNVRLDLRQAAYPVKGAIFYIFDRGELISEEVRSVDTRDFASFAFELPGRSGSAGVKGVDVRLIFERGEITPRMPIQ